MLVAEANVPSHPWTNSESWLQTELSPNPTSHLTNTCLWWLGGPRGWPQSSLFPKGTFHSFFLYSFIHSFVCSADLTKHSAGLRRSPADNLGQGFVSWGQGPRSPGVEDHPRFSPLCLQTAHKVKGRVTSEGTQDNASI